MLDRSRLLYIQLVIIYRDLPGSKVIGSWEQGMVTRLAKILDLPLFVRDSNTVFPENIHCNGNETTLGNCYSSAIKHDPMGCVYRIARV